MDLDGRRPPHDDAPRLRLEELLTQLVDRAQETLRTQERLRGLLQANQSIVGDLDLPVVLRRIVEAARDLVGAQYAALGVIAPDGSGLEEFVHTGMADADVDVIGHLPQGKGLLGALIDDPYAIRLDHIDEDVRSAGFPAGHPHMDSFLGVPIRVRDEVFGNLYLTNATSGHFDEDDEALASALAATAAVAIENARLFHASRHRQLWLAAAADLTRDVLAVTDQSPFQRLVETVRRLADVDVVTLVLPVDGGTSMEVTAGAGEGTGALLGRRLPVAGSWAQPVFATGEALRVANASERGVDGPELPFALSVGPAMLLPLTGARGVRGVVMVGRRHGRRRFTDTDLENGCTFATHASLALELADARRDQEQMSLLEDRTRIARDLHDHVIQALFAAGMTVQGVATGLDDDGRAAMLDKVVDTLDLAVKQIRTSIFQLRPRADAANSLRAAVLAVVSDVVPALGFEPHVSFEGPVDAVSDASLSEDVRAVVREALTNTAKHARASTAGVRLHASASGFQVMISDDGVGITGDRRSGLANLQGRAARRGGILLVNAPAPDSGTTLLWSVPLG